MNYQQEFKNNPNLEKYVQLEKGKGGTQVNSASNAQHPEKTIFIVQCPISKW